MGGLSDSARRPLVRARVSIPRLAVSTPIEFLVDTGADRTAIHWNDRQTFEGAGAPLPLPADAAFPETVTLSGISGQRIRYGLDEALLSFRSEQVPVLLVRMAVGIALDPIPGVPAAAGAAADGSRQGRAVELDGGGAIALGREERKRAMDTDTGVGSWAPEGRRAPIPDEANAGARAQAIGFRIATLERGGVLYETEVVRWARWEYCSYAPLDEVRRGMAARAAGAGA